MLKELNCDSQCKIIINVKLLNKIIIENMSCNLNTIMEWKRIGYMILHDSKSIVPWNAIEIIEFIEGFEDVFLSS